MVDAGQQGDPEQPCACLMQVMVQLFHLFMIALVINDLPLEDVADQFSDRCKIRLLYSARSDSDVARDRVKHAVNPGLTGIGAGVRHVAGRGQRTT